MTVERPILFSGPMVRAILEGRKTQTRRVVKPTQSEPKVAPLRMEPWVIDGEQQEDDNGAPAWAGFHPEYPGEAKWFTCPYGQPGERLWVRETWQESKRIVDLPATLVHYSADDVEVWKDGIVLPFSWANQTKKRPSIFMPRWASRITLEITGVRVERVQDISEADAQAEGVQDYMPQSNHGAYETFAMLWSHINEKRGYGWTVNPWVWVVEFKRV